MNRIFIINPVAGDKESVFIARHIIRMYPDAWIQLTEYPGHATEIARRFSKTNSIVYAVGGDTTAKEVLNGLIGGNCILSIIPCGSGNDYVKSFTDEKDIRFFLKEDLEIHKVDVGKVNGEFFLNNAVIGLPAEIGEMANNIKDPSISPEDKYKKCILKAILHYKFPHLNISFNECNLNSKTTMLAIGKGKCFGGGFKIFPRYNLTNESLSMCFVDEMLKSLIPFMALDLLKGKHESDHNVSLFHSDKVLVTCDHPVICNVDGQSLICDHFDFSIYDEQIDFGIPKQKYKGK